jgi:O-antigen/teichoic acid export membrane protein
MPHGAGGDLHFARSSAGVFLLVVASAVVGVLTQLALTRSLGVVEYGRYAIAVGWGLAIAAPAMAGLDASIVRFASPFFDKSQGAQLRQFAFFMGCVQLAVIGLATAAVLLTPVRHLALPGLNEPSGFWLVLFIGSTAFLGTFSVFFIVFRKFLFSQLYQNFVRPLLLVGSILAGLSATHGAVRAEFALAATGFTSAVALVLLIIHLAWALRRFGRSGVAVLEPKRWVTFAGWAQIGSIAQQSAAQFPVIFLGALATPAQAGYFAVAARVSSLVTFGLAAVGTASAPLISSAYAKGDWDTIANLARLASRLATAVALATCVLVLLAGPQLMALFGHGFSEAYAPLLVLLAGCLFSAFCGVNTILLAMTNRPKFAVLALFSGAVATVVCSYVLVPKYGSLGGAFSASAGMVLSNAMMVVRIRRTIGIDSTAMGLSRVRVQDQHDETR